MNEEVLHQARERALADAFAQFNQLSADLAHSYHELEQRVELLNAELAAARSERLVQLAEKERLANRLSRLLEVLPGGVIVMDARNVIREANPTALEFLEEPVLDVAWETLLQQRFIAPAPASGELHHRSGRRLGLTRRALESEPGEIMLFQDVTEARALQERLDRNDRLAAMGEMIAGLAHQIRTPLAAVLLYLGHLEQAHVSAEQRCRVVGKIKGRISHLEGLVGDMLQFVRGGAGELTPCRLGRLIDELLELAAPIITASDVHFELHWQSPTLANLHLPCQQSALAGAMLNLVNNAIQAGGPGLELFFSIERHTGGWVEIALEDNGPGIDAAITDRLFEPFFTTRTQGTGLGLAVVRAVMEAHQGEVRQEIPRRLSGARFCLRLPVPEWPDQRNDDG